MRRLLLYFVLFLLPLTLEAQQKDSEKLGMALDYFQSGKYQEALNILQKLDEHYDLNPRFKAYMGVCYYYKWDYKNACRYLDETLPKLDIYAPHEQAVYYYADAESHFNQAQYGEAVPLYEKFITVCYDNEKGDAFFKIGLCYTFRAQWQDACESLQSAQSYYQQFSNTPANKARIEQIKKMINGCQEKLKSIEPTDSIHIG
jgi:tetratricopeptide (TPR) repeat protein